MEVTDAQRLDTISAALYHLLKGQVPEPLNLSDKNDEINQVGTFVNRLISEQKKLLEETIKLSKGELSSKINSQIPLANGIKGLQAALKHLTWQTKQIANGDFSQRTDFLGEFSESFNWMASQLESNQLSLLSEISERTKIENELRNAYDHMESLVEERTKEIKTVNIALQDEIKEKTAFQEALRESEEMFKAIAVSALDSIILMDDHGCILYWNEAAKKMFQYTDIEAIGNDLHDLLAPQKYHKKFRNKFSEFIISGSGPAIGKRLELEAKRKDNKIFPVELSLSAIKIKNKWHAIGTIRDISEQKAKEQLERQVIKSNKMEAIGTLAGGIAHDFNNILSAILGYTELSVMEIPKDSPLENNLQQVYKAGHRAKDLVRQILTVARQSEDVMKLIQIEPIVKEALKLVRSSIPSTIEIVQKINSKSLIMGDPTQIHQIFMNLFTNAAHAMEEKGGILSVSISNIVLSINQNIQGLKLKPGTYIEVKISDSGAGIPENILLSIFEPYFTTKAPGKGTGLGLAIVHGIVKSHGGEIVVESMLKKGSTFTIYLPITKRSTKSEPDENENLPSGNEHILFVDDEIPIADMTGQILKRLGYSVSVLTNSMEALDLFRNSPADFDLVITDMTMPNMTGETLAAELLKIRSNIPIIICTGYNKKISEDIENLGIKAICQKPLSIRKLATIIRKTLD